MKPDAPHRLRVIVFFTPDWNFVDGTFPHLRRVSSKLGTRDFTGFHNGFEIRVRGDAESDFDRIMKLLGEAAATPYFPGFRIGIAEGVSAGKPDEARIAADAWKNGHNARSIAGPKAGEGRGSLSFRLARFARAFGALWRSV
jgi:hypothetical protein